MPTTGSARWLGAPLHHSLAASTQPVHSWACMPHVHLRAQPQLAVGCQGCSMCLQGPLDLYLGLWSVPLYTIPTAFIYFWWGAFVCLPASHLSLQILALSHCLSAAAAATSSVRPMS